MPRRHRTTSTDDWQQLELRFTDPIQRVFALIRPIVLFGASAMERAHLVPPRRSAPCTAMSNASRTMAYAGCTCSLDLHIRCRTTCATSLSNSTVSIRRCGCMRSRRFAMCAPDGGLMPKPSSMSSQPRRCRYEPASIRRHLAARGVDRSSCVRGGMSHACRNHQPRGA